MSFTISMLTKQKDDFAVNSYGVLRKANKNIYAMKNVDRTRVKRGKKISLKLTKYQCIN